MNNLKKSLEVSIMTFMLNSLIFSFCRHWKVCKEHRRGFLRFRELWSQFWLQDERVKVVQNRSRGNSARDSREIRRGVQADRLGGSVCKFLLPLDACEVCSQLISISVSSKAYLINSQNSSLQTQVHEKFELQKLLHHKELPQDWWDAMWTEQELRFATE